MHNPQTLPPIGLLLETQYGDTHCDVIIRLFVKATTDMIAATQLIQFSGFPLRSTGSEHLLGNTKGCCSICLKTIIASDV